MAQLTEKQLRIAKLKSEGKTNRDIAKIEYPDAKDHAGEVIVSRELKKGHVAKYVEQGREIALKKYGVTWDILIAKLVIMLNADKSDFHTGEILPDFTVQMSALKELAKMLDKPTQDRTTPIDNKDLVNALNNSIDDVELQRLVFRKNGTTDEE